MLSQRVVSGPLASEPLGSCILNVTFTSPGRVRVFLRTQLAGLDHGVFGVLFLGNGHRVIAFEEMFRDAVNGTSVYPREIAQRSLHQNGGALILARLPGRRPASPARLMNF